MADIGPTIGWLARAYVPGEATRQRKLANAMGNMGLHGVWRGIEGGVTSTYIMATGAAAAYATGYTKTSVGFVCVAMLCVLNVANFISKYREFFN